MKNLIIIFLIFFSIKAYSQDTLNYSVYYDSDKNYSKQQSTVIVNKYYIQYDKHIYFLNEIPTYYMNINQIVYHVKDGVIKIGSTYCIFYTTRLKCRLSNIERK